MSSWRRMTLPVRTWMSGRFSLSNWTRLLCSRYISVCLPVFGVCVSVFFGEGCLTGCFFRNISCNIPI